MRSHCHGGSRLARLANLELSGIGSMLNRRQAALPQVRFRQSMLRLWAVFYKLIAQGQSGRRAGEGQQYGIDGLSVWDPNCRGLIAFLLGVSHFQTQTWGENT